MALTINILLSIIGERFLDIKKITKPNISKNNDLNTI